MNRYKTHYKPNCCGHTGFQSKYTTNLNDVTCIPCLVKNLMKAYTDPKFRKKIIKEHHHGNDSQQLSIVTTGRKDENKNL